MDRRFLTVVGLALIFALVITTVFYFQFAAQRAEARSQPSVTNVVVATKPLAVGVSIKAGDVKLTKTAADQLPRGSFSKIEEVLDRPVVSNILLDEPVLEGRLAARGSGLGLAPIIPVGMRAVSVSVSDVSGVAGFVLPGLRVDVLVTGRPSGTSASVTTTCLQNLLVLSAGQTIQPDARGQAIQTPTVTLLADPAQAEVLTLAGNEGRVQLVLRNSADQEIAKTPGTESNLLYGRARAPEAPAVISQPRKPRPVPVSAKAIAPPALPEVVVIRGNTRTVEMVPAKIN